MPSPLRDFIDDAGLDFALKHIFHFYDTDFFPRAHEFIALAHSWTEVKEFILRSDLHGLLTATPLVEPWPKARGGFRIVHRLEPLDSVVFTAFAQKVGEQVEAARASPEVACSYRISIGDHGFFSDGSGFHVYRERNEALAASYPYVLSADISDFYNRIYLHRLQNALQSACDTPPGISKSIEGFLSWLNSKSSQGVPVGPTASIVMAEAALIDVDQFLFERGFEHVRYVDDFQIFGPDRGSLEILLQEFCVYLHENQRLSLSPEKTRIRPSEEFLRQELNNQYQLQKLAILSEIEIVSPYGLEAVTPAPEINENAADILLDAINRITKFEHIDLGVVRAIVRRARANRIQEVAPALLEHLTFFRAAANDIFLYLDSISDPDFISNHITALESLHSSPAANFRAVRLWLEWYYARHHALLEIASIRAFVFSSKSLRPQADAAVTLKQQSWVKSRKNGLLHYASWDRRSILIAARLLSKDERDNWLKPLLKSEKLEPIERWIAKWVLDGCPAAEPPGDSYDDAIPF